MKKVFFGSIALVLSTVGSYVLLAQQQAPAAGQRGAAPAGQGQQPQNPMSFFIASVGSGDGANLGGLAGADALCTRLANAPGTGNPMAPHTGKTWRAYLSTQAQGG